MHDSPCLDRRGSQRRMLQFVLPNLATGPRFRPPLSNVIGVLTAFIVASAPLTVAAADLSIDKYFDQLRERQLYVLAETACETRLARPDLPFSERVEYTLQLSRTLAAHARSSDPDERKLQWDRAVQLLDDLMQHPDSEPQRVRLAVQKAFVVADQGEFLKWQSVLAPHDQSLNQAAQTTLQSACSQLRKLQDQLGQEVSAGLRRRRSAGQLKLHELRQLEYNVRYRLGSALLDLALVSPLKSAERAGALIEAEEVFRRFSGGPPGERMTVLGSIMLARCYRLRGNWNGVDERLQQLDNGQLDEPLKDELVAERAELQLAAGQPREAVELLSEYRKQRGMLTGRLTFLRLQSLIAVWRMVRELKRDDLADELIKQIRLETQQAERTAEMFWVYRCRRLLQETETARTYGGELAALIRQAQALFASRELDAAAARYASAAEWAAENEMEPEAAEFLHTAGSIQLENSQTDEAAELFQQVFANYPQSPQAAPAHLLWCYCLGIRYDEQRTAATRVAYTAALEQHLAGFAQSNTSADAHWMLGRLLERRLQYTQALPHFLAIPEDHDRGLDGMVHAARCYESILNRLDTLGRDASEWSRRATTDLMSFTGRFANAPQLAPGQREILVRLARIRLRPPADYQQADQLLGRALQDASSGADTGAYQEWIEKTAVQLRVISLAGQGQPQAAMRLVTQLADDDVSEVLQVLDGLSEMALQANEETRRQVGRLQLSAAQELLKRRSELNADQQQHLNVCLAQALIATDRTREALGVYDSLLERSPHDIPLLEQAAEALVRVGEPAMVSAAAGHWRTIERQLSPGSTAWIRARYHAILCDAQQGKTEQALTLLKLTRQLYSDLGSDQWRRRFEDLERELTGETR